MKKDRRMKGEELEFYRNLPKFQKDLVDVLIALGFKHMYFNTYNLEGWGEINVKQFSHWSDVLIHVHQQGKDQKRFEILRALAID